MAGLFCAHHSFTPVNLKTTEVMFQMPQVIYRQRFQRPGFRRSPTAVHQTGQRQCFVIHVGPDMAQVPVEQYPQLNQVGHRVSLVILKPHPIVLPVNNMYASAFMLCAYETLDIVLGRIDEMADNLFFTPFTRRRTRGERRFGKAIQLGGLTLDGFE